MTRIGLLSDTHSHWDERYIKYFQDCDQIWHAGDIGTLQLADRLRQIAPLHAVYGNIDAADIRHEFPEIQQFQCEQVQVLIKHIGGYPGRYDPSIYHQLLTWAKQTTDSASGNATDNTYGNATPTRLFISGHSHILKVMMDKRLGILHINPGAAGLYGQQPVRTLIRFTIDHSDIRDLEVIELR